ncbi:MAG TPA: hypothetical protein VJ987_03720 [Anaerolineales bacterium]|nr:hypothetical protein [Anaerolineales bacterium]
MAKPSSSVGAIVVAVAGADVDVGKIMGVEDGEVAARLGAEGDVNPGNVQPDIKLETRNKITNLRWWFILPPG